jgi:hypothetical protein
MTVYINGTTGISGVDGSAGTPALQGTDTNTGISFGSDVIIGSTGGVERFRVDSQGRLGLGTTSVAALLHLNGGNAALPVTSGTTQSAGNRLRLSTASGSGILDVGCAGGSGMWLQSTDLTDLSIEYPLLLNPNGGAVGVGTTSPQQALHVLTAGGTNGAIQLGGSTYYGIIEHDAASTGANIYTVASLSGGGHIFRRGSTEHMRINVLGAFKVTNTGSYTAGSPAHEINQSSSTSGVLELYHSSTSTPYGIYQKFTAADPNNTGQYVFKAEQNTGVNIYAIWSNGTVSARSDARYKKNVESARNGYLEDIAQLRVVKYNWYNHDDEAPKELGFIAQEVEQVFPGLVLSEPEKDKDGNETGEFCKSIKTSVFTPMLVKALQEAHARIEQLEARLAALEAS